MTRLMVRNFGIFGKDFCFDEHHLCLRSVSTKTGMIDEFHHEHIRSYPAGFARMIIETADEMSPSVWNLPVP